MLGSVGMKSFYFFFWKAIKIAGLAQKNRVGRVSGNAGWPIFLGLSTIFTRAGSFVLVLNQSYETNSGLPS